MAGAATVLPAANASPAARTLRRLMRASSFLPACADGESPLNLRPRIETSTFRVHPGSGGTAANHMPSSVARGDDYFFRSARNGQTLYEGSRGVPSSVGRSGILIPKAMAGGSEAHPPLCTSGAPPLFRERQ